MSDTVRRYFIGICLLFTLSLGNAPTAWAVVGSPAQYGAFILYGAAPPLAGGPLFNLCLDVPNANFYVGASLQAYACNNTVAQDWSVTLQQFTGQDGVVFNAYKISPTVRSDLCLDVSGLDYQTGHVQLWSCNGGANQSWTVGSQILSAGAQHVVNTSNAIARALAPSGNTNNSVVNLEVYSTDQRHVILAASFPLALITEQAQYPLGSSQGIHQIIDYGDEQDTGLPACLNAQSWGAASATTLNLQSCNVAETSANVFDAEGQLPLNLSAAEPPLQQQFFFENINNYQLVPGAGVKLISASLLQCVDWTGNAATPTAWFNTCVSRSEQRWWIALDLLGNTMISTTDDYGNIACLDDNDRVNYGLILSPGSAVNVNPACNPAMNYPNYSPPLTGLSQWDISGVWE